VGLHPHSELDSVSTTMLTPYPGTPFRKLVESENRLLDVPWSHYDTAHLTFTPKSMTVEEMRSAYDWLCRKIYSPTQIARRGLRSLGRYPLSMASKKGFRQLQHRLRLPPHLRLSHHISVGRVRVSSSRRYSPQERGNDAVLSQSTSA
jgi:hypothetical protein